MIMLNRRVSLYDACQESSLEKRIEWGFDFVRSLGVKPLREDDVLAWILKE